MDQYVAEGAWPSHKKIIVEDIHKGSELDGHVVIDHSLVSPRKVDHTEDNAPVPRMDLGDVQAPTPLQRRSTLILDDGHEDEETIVHHHNDDQHLLVPYHSQNDSDDDDFESANEVYSSEHFESATDDDHDSNGNDSADNPNPYNESWAIFHPALNNKNTANITDNINLTLNETIAPNNVHADNDDSGWHDMHSQWRRASNVAPRSKSCTS